MKSGLLPIKNFVIPISILSQTIAFLRQVGVQGMEGFVLWAGSKDVMEERRFRFQSFIIPEQRAMLTDSGLLVAVDGKALFDVNKAVHGRNQILAAQIHSHPTSAYHSSTDDAFPLVTLMGSLSIVIPDFAKNAPDDLERWAWYRLSNRSRWEPATKNTKIDIE